MIFLLAVSVTILLWSCTIGINTEFYVQHPVGTLLCSETYRKRGECKSVTYDAQHFSCFLKNGSQNLVSSLIRNGTKILGLRKVSMCIPICGESCESLTRRSSVSWCRENKLDDISNRTEDDDLSLLQPQLMTEATPTAVQAINPTNINRILHHACEVGKLCLVQYILTKGLTDINCRGIHGRTPVLTAARMGQTEVFDFLVNLGCDLSAEDDNTGNALHMGCIGGNTDIVRKLIVNEKYDIESRGELGWTPVMYAAYHGQREIVDLLADKGCNLMTVDDNKDTIIHVACMGGHVDLVKYILKTIASSVEQRGSYARTPIMSAIEHGHIGVVRFLVRKGCNLRAVDNMRDTILHVACMGGHVHMVKYILSMKVVGTEERGGYGRTPLMAAIRNGHVAVVKFLVDKGCSLGGLDNYKNTILHVACIGGHVHMVKYILSMKVIGIEEGGRFGRTPVMTATIYDYVGVVKFLVSKGCNLRVMDEKKDTILHIACRYGSLHVVKYILSLKIVDMEVRTRYGKTPLMTAVFEGHTALVKLLIGKGCNHKALDVRGNNILHRACLGGHVDMVRDLIKLVDKKKRNKLRQKPDDLGICKSNPSVVALFQNGM